MTNALPTEPSSQLLHGVYISHRKELFGFPGVVNAVDVIDGSVYDHGTLE